MKGPLGQLMRQAQQAQDAIKKMQAELALTEITGESGAGLVRVTINGKHEARRVEIAPDALTEGKEFLEDLIAAAINDATQKLERDASEKMAKATGGLNLPAGLGL